MTVAAPTAPARGRQPMTALAKANRRRKDRARHLRRLREAGNGGGPRHAESFRVAATMLTRLPACLRTLDLYLFLTSCRGCKRATALQVIGRLGCSERRQLGELTDRQRKALIDLLRGDLSNGRS